MGFSAGRGIARDNIGFSNFAQGGGLGKADQLFGEQRPKQLEELIPFTK